MLVKTKNSVKTGVLMVLIIGLGLLSSIHAQNQPAESVTPVKNLITKKSTNSGTKLNSNQNSQPRTLAALSFTDITATVFSMYTGYGAHGSMFADVNDDGYPDLYVTMYKGNELSEESEDRFFVNQQTGTPRFDEDAFTWHIEDYDASHGGCWADLDNDGDYDLINGTTYEDAVYGNNNIYEHIDNSSTYFTEVTPSVMSSRTEKTRAVLALDWDEDGDLDIFTVTGYMGSGDDPGEDNELYVNKLIDPWAGAAAFAFRDTSDGVAYQATAGQGAVDTDYDGDGDIDIIASNRTGKLVILQNNSGVFSAVDPSTIGLKYDGTDVVTDGISMGDYDNDGDLDMLLVDVIGEKGLLYKNNGNGTFTYSIYWGADIVVDVDGYMGGFADLDNDGYLDIVFAGSSPAWINDGAGNFTAGPAIPLTDVADPRSIAFADYDNDGDLDFVFGVYGVGGTGNGTRFIENGLTSGGNYLKVKLTAPNGQAGAFGAKVFVYSDRNAGVEDELLGMREAQSNHGYLAQDDPVLHFGLGTNTHVDVVVEYLDGTTATRTHQATTAHGSSSTPLGVDRADVKIGVKVFLQGPYSAGSMTTTVRDNGDVPLTSPYSEDPREVEAIPSGVTDWVLVELRATVDGAAVAWKSAFLKSDGTLVDDDGNSGITMDAAAGSYFVAVHHQNHISVISDETTAFNTSTLVTYDFTTGLSQYEGGEAADLGSGIYGMFAGDPNETQFINSADYLIVKTRIGALGYYIEDCNRTGVVNSADYLVIKNNIGESTNVP